ncbi:MAG: hypothetical protein LBS10_10920 [Gracilibacteraceae bacterium]|jgi:hypothetical protein|nr:hypothetical protein [Gracilibacteraceae bacterium]
MIVTIKFITVDIDPDIAEMTLDLPAAAALADALQTCMEQQPRICREITAQAFVTSTVLRRSTPLTLSDRLVDGDELTLLRPLGGG